MTRRVGPRPSLPPVRHGLPDERCQLSVAGLRKNLPELVTRALLSRIPTDATSASLKFRATKLTSGEVVFRAQIGEINVQFDLPASQCQRVNDNQKVSFLVDFDGETFSLTSTFVDVPLVTSPRLQGRSAAIELKQITCGQLIISKGSECDGLVLRWIDRRSKGHSFFVRLFAQREKMEEAQRLFLDGIRLPAVEDTTDCYEGLIPAQPGIEQGRIIKVRVARIFQDGQGIKIDLEAVS